jgi:peptidoglycan/LPS O-acetylase OafA/YrhL
MGNAGKDNHFRVDLQALRGVAILLVLIFHLPKSNFSQGFLGVDIFFVISGFLITPRIVALFSHTSCFGEVKEEFFRFAINRFRRLAPAFAVTSLIFLPLILFFGDVNLRQVVTNQVVAGFLLLGNVGAYKFAGDYFHPGVSNPFLHIWSLAVEEQIYVFLPILFLLLYTMGRRRFKILAVVTIIGLSLASLFLTFFNSPVIDLYSKIFTVPSNFVFYSPITRFWEFGVGGLISFLYSSHKELNCGRWLANFYNLLFLTILIFPTGLNSNLKLLLVILFTGGLVITRSLDALPVQILKPLTYLGDRSYSLYLVHLPIFYLVTSSPLVLKYFPNGVQLQILLALVFSFAIAGWIYKSIELRYHSMGFNRGNSQKTMRRKSALFLLVGSSFVVTLAFIPIVGSGYFGVLSKPSNQNAGIEFKEYCMREDSFRQFPCVFPISDSSKTVMLLGDSHATQYSLMLWELLKDKDYKLILSGDFGGAVDSSRTIEDVRTYQPDITIVSKYWRTDQFLENSELIAGLNEIEKLSKRMIVVGQNPVFTEGESNPGISLFQTLLGANSKKIAFLKSQLPVPESKVSDNLIRNWALVTGVEYLDVFRTLCPRTFCERQIQNERLYIDSNHLSVFGAEMLRSNFSALILK